MITVYGVLGLPSPALQQAAARADLVVGGARHLAALGVSPERGIVLGRLDPALAALAALPADREAVVLASGDPGFHGILRRLRAIGLRPTVVTAPTSVAAAHAAVGLPWDDAVVVTAHGRDLTPAINAARSHDQVAVLTAPGHGLRELAGALSDLGRTFVLAERLGEEDERVRVLTTAEAQGLSDITEPNVVLVLAESPERMPATSPPTFCGVASPGHYAPRVAPVTPAPGQAAAGLLIARVRPRTGSLVFAEGPVGAEVAEVARHFGAAVISASAIPLPPGNPDLDLAVTDDPTHLPALSAGNPQFIVLSAAREADCYRSLLTRHFPHYTISSIHLAQTHAGHSTSTALVIGERP